MLTCLFLSPFCHAQSNISEPQLRAGVMIGVLRYSNFTSNRDPAHILVCGIGDTPGFSVLAQFKSDIVIADKSLEFRPLTQLPESTACPVTIVGANVAAAQLARLSTLKTLTICDTCAQPDQYAVTLFTSNHRIRFNVNISAAQNAGIHFSAAMLELAAEVKE